MISVITVVLNGEAYIEDTIKSVILQDYPNVEFIVIDGGSIDATTKILCQYGPQIAYWVSEPDEGIADAMNKGILNSTGRYLFFLHADDYFFSTASLSIASKIINDHSDLHAFPIYYSTSNRITKRRPRGFNFWLNFKTGLHHQGVFFDRRIFDRLGLYDTSFRIAMDYEFFLRAQRAGAKLQLHDEPVAVMRDTGVSSRRDWQTLQARFREEMRVHQKHLNSDLLRRLYSLYWPFYMAYRRLRAATAL